MVFAEEEPMESTMRLTFSTFNHRPKSQSSSRAKQLDRFVNKTFNDKAISHLNFNFDKQAVQAPNEFTMKNDTFRRVSMESQLEEASKPDN